MHLRGVWRVIGMAIVAAAAAGLFAAGSRVGGPDVPGTARLIAFEPSPQAEGLECDWEVATLDASQYVRSSASRAAYQRASTGSAASAATLSGPGLILGEETDRKHLRFIMDPSASFSNVRLDYTNNEVVLLDANHNNIFVFDRLTNTPPTGVSRPKRAIGGVKTNSQYATDAYVDQKTGEIYAINNDSLPGFNVFAREANGDVPPVRSFPSPYGSYGIATDEERQEIYTTVQHDGAIVVWPKMFNPKVRPLRLIQGNQTHMADPHGIAFDPKRRLLYVVNFGTSRETRQQATNPDGSPRIPNWPAGNLMPFRYRQEVVNGTGKFGPPSLTVFRADSEGNVAPVRIVEGPKTQMNWPTGVAVDPERNEVYIANDLGDSVLVFNADAQGDVAPARVLSGDRTQLRHPLGLFVDTVNDELWVANFGNHSATVYRRGASGNTAPIRVIRSAPAKDPSTELNNPFSISYDPTRDEILVPNCVGHPRIAAFSKNADKNAVPVRTIQGQKTLLNRTVHSITYDDVHDEIIVNQNIGQAILTFRGGASGDEPPIRILAGPKTGFRDPQSLAVDPVHDELFVMNMSQNDRVMVFDRTAHGDVAPKRVLMGPDTMLGATVVAVDPVHDLLITGGNVPRVGYRILIFDRTASGNAKPLRVIGGPKSGLAGISGHGLRVYPPTGTLLVNVRAAGGEDAVGGAFTGIWSIDDNGDVPPRLTMGKGLMLQPRGLTYDVESKTVIVADKMLQGVLTYSVPEIFEPTPRITAQAR
jgi:DNA-binding beta-propeller fold protein YncE